MKDHELEHLMQRTAEAISLMMAIRLDLRGGYLEDEAEEAYQAIAAIRRRIVADVKHAHRCAA